MKVGKMVLYMVFLFYSAAYAQPDGLRVTLGTIANGYSVRMEVNGHYIADILGG